MNHATPVKATPLPTVEAVLASDIPGSYCITADHLAANCPCGCGTFMHLPINRTGLWANRGWKWDLNDQAPSITPSIRDLGGCHFHGYLTAGTWTFCSDSGQ